MPKKGKEVKEVKEVKEETPKVEKKGKITSATVYSATGNVVRTYTDEMGKDFEKKAAGYATKIGGTMKTA